MASVFFENDIQDGIIAEEKITAWFAVGNC